ncbi:MAG: 3'-5' exonuclease [Cytophagia bacterium]|nr:MAG: 3'-5' exonuclease [Cytophagia bacterium]TAG42618.1 MAG: 3'-5' exonuclease [Cytophagia bacterium]TAH29227.1 MAG: 3'-5' exonuclease [Cytophagales bacterium]
MAHYLVLDLEMSGTNVEYNEIIQIGAVLYDENWKELGQFLDNVYPEDKDNFSASAEAVHGLTWEELQDAPMLHELLPELEDWIVEKIGIRKPTTTQKENTLRNVIICGQSVINDINFLKFAYKKENLKWNYSYTLMDLHTLSYFLFEIFKENKMDTPKGRSLGKIAEFFGFNREDSLHNALEDAVLTGKCFKKIMEYTKTLTIQK